MATRGRLTGLWRNPDFLKLWGGETVAFFGLHLSALALPLTAAVWPEILKAISDSNIRNYTIFLKEPENILFAYWEYHGSDFKARRRRGCACIRE